MTASFMPLVKAEVTRIEIEFWGKKIPSDIALNFQVACEILDDYDAMSKTERKE